MAPVLLLLATVLAAQTSWNSVTALTVGTEVRVTAGSRSVSGTISRSADDRPVVISGKGEEALDRQQVSAVSVKQPRHRGRNALIGLAAGTGVGLGIGIAARTRSNQLAVVPNYAITAGFTAAGALVGTLVGAIVPSGGWREIYKK